MNLPKALDNHALGAVAQTPRAFLFLIDFILERLLIQQLAPYPLLHQFFLGKIRGHLNLMLVFVEEVEVVSREDLVTHASDDFRVVNLPAALAGD
jgi:hypothetical protein